MADGFVLRMCPTVTLSSPGKHLVAQLDLPPGKYVVVAKANVALVSTAPFDGGGFAQLTLGGEEDEAWSHVSKSNNWAMICLTLGAELTAQGQVQLFFNLASGIYGGPVILSYIKISAIRLEGLTLTDIPCG